MLIVKCPLLAMAVVAGLSLTGPAVNPVQVEGPNCPAGTTYVDSPQEISITGSIVAAYGDGLVGCFASVQLVVTGKIEAISSKGAGIRFYAQDISIQIEPGAAVRAHGENGIAIVVDGPAGASAQIKVGGELVGKSGIAIQGGAEDDSVILGPTAQITGKFELGGGTNTTTHELKATLNAP